jgi:hypothetical protein
MSYRDEHKTLAYRFFLFDTFFNWALGIMFLFFFRPLERLMSKGPLLPDYLWIIIGAVLLLYGIWQTYVVLSGTFSRNVRLFCCITAWGPVLLLSYALLFMGFDLYLAAHVLIWTGNIYMLVLGTLYFRSMIRPYEN